MEIGVKRPKKIMPRTMGLTIFPSHSPLNKAWFHLGEWLENSVSPIVLGLIFFGLLTPISILTRLFGRDELRLKRRAVNSYWVDRTPPRPTAQSFRNQF